MLQPMNAAIPRSLKVASPIRELRIGIDRAQFGADRPTLPPCRKSPVNATR
jgi:hypothetical protein